MADRVVPLLDSLECRVTMGAAARRKVTQRHDISGAAPRIMEIIERTHRSGWVSDMMGISHRPPCILGGASHDGNIRSDESDDYADERMLERLAAVLRPSGRSPSLIVGHGVLRRRWLE